MLSSRPYQRRGKVGHRGSRLQHFEFTLLSHITIHLTSFPPAPGCSLHHIHCQVKHPGPLFNTPHHSPTLALTPALMCPSRAGQRIIRPQFASTPIYRHLYLEYEKPARFCLSHSRIWGVRKMDLDCTDLLHVQVQGLRFAHSSEPRLPIYPLKYIL